MTFHGEERFRHLAARGEEHGHEEHPHGDPKESPWVITVPLVVLAIGSVYTGWAYIGDVVFGDFFGGSIVVAPHHEGLAEMRAEWRGALPFVLHGPGGLPFWLGLLGIAVAWFLWSKRPELPGRIAAALGGFYTFLLNNYFIDKFNDWFFAGGFRRIGTVASEVGDRSIIDGFFVNGSARVVAATSALLRHIQTGRVYHYAFAMILSVLALLTWWAIR
jgi:NADH-quinone oxidoreductase subunit L